MPVIAINKQGQKQEFNDFSWSKMKNMNHDWTEILQQEMINVMPPAVKLPTGEAKEVFIENKISANTHQEILNKKESVKSNEQKIVSKEQKEQFLKAIEGTPATMIKDYFDKQDVPYHKKAKIEELQSDFAEYLDYSLEAFQKAFE